MLITRHCALGAFHLGANKNLGKRLQARMHAGDNAYASLSCDNVIGLQIGLQTKNFGALGYLVGHRLSARSD